MFYLLPSFDDFKKLKFIYWPLVLMIFLLCSVGIFALFCASEGSFDPWAFKQGIKIFIGFILLCYFAIFPLRELLALSYVAYGISLALLVSAQLFGRIGMGARRWVSLGFFELQPSEVMKISLILALSTYLHKNPLNMDQNSKKTLTVAFLMILVPTVLLLKQPDLGTASLLVLSGGIVLFAAGLSRRMMVYMFSFFTLSLPIFWPFLHDYQRQRILTFLNPEQDPLGAGYHILQSKIAIGSGGLWGKGFLKGTQVHLDFLPEKHTDFILTILAEEWGYFGIFTLIILYILVLLMTLRIALDAQHLFGRLLVLGVGAMFFLYCFINIAMVTGLFPVVGVPLPFISYGGASLVSLFIAFGWVINVDLNKNERL